VARPSDNLHTAPAASHSRESDEHSGARNDRTGPDSKGPEAVNDTVLPRRHGCLWDIVSAIVGLLIGFAIVAAIIAGAAYFMGFI
jgi:hypothetical protein